MQNAKSEYYDSFSNNTLKLLLMCLILIQLHPFGADRSTYNRK